MEPKISLETKKRALDSYVIFSEYFVMDEENSVTSRGMDNIIEKLYEKEEFLKKNTNRGCYINALTTRGRQNPSCSREKMIERSKKDRITYLRFGQCQFDALHR